MLAPLCFLVFAVAFTVSKYDYTANKALPSYIRKALIEKNNYMPRPHAKRHTLTNLTLHEVFAKIKDITRNLNANAKREGFKVDYKFRVM